MMNTAEIKAALRTKYDKQAYALLFEVGNGTGANCRRHADAVAMSLWPSRGLELIGHEFKASRSDWMRELEKPEKAELVFQYCDRWYLVAGDKSIVKPGELPPTWGLMVPRGDALVVATEAPKLEPNPLNRSFLAALLRRGCEQSVDAAELKKAEERGFGRGVESAKFTMEHFEDKYNELHKIVDEFQAASGVLLHNAWEGGERIGEAVRMVLDGRHKSGEREIKSLHRIAKKLVETIEREAGELLQKEEAEVLAVKPPMPT